MWLNMCPGVRRMRIYLDLLEMTVNWSFGTYGLTNPNIQSNHMKKR